MTVRQEEVLNYIVRFKEVNGYAPTVREIAQGINTKSTTHVREMLEQLREQGYISYKDNSARTIKVLKFHIVK